MEARCKVVNGDGVQCGRYFAHSGRCEFAAKASSPTAMKFDGGKLRYDLVDVHALAWLVASLTFGVTKYAADNWRNFSKDELRTKYYAALVRHLEAWRAGEDDDPETGLPHLAGVGFGWMVLAATFAPRDLGEVLKRTSEAARRYLVKKASEKGE